MLENLLSTCGLNLTEQKILFFLLERGWQPAALIAKGTGIKRPTIYAALNNLERLTLVHSKRKQSTTHFTAASPELIPQILQHQAQEKFNEVKTATHLLGPQLQSLVREELRDFGSFEIVSFESLPAFYAQLEDALMGGSFAAIFNPQLALIPETLPSVKKYLQSTAKTRPLIREIAVAGPMAKWYQSQIRNPNHKLKILPKETAIFEDIIMLKDSVVICDYSKNKPSSAVKITQRRFYETMMTIFNLLWSTLPNKS